LSKTVRIVASILCVILVASAFTACQKQEPLPEGTVAIDDAKTGEKVAFGRYEQDDIKDNGQENIIWIVAEAQKDKLLLVSEKVLDTRKYNNDRKKVTWEESTVRAWLNADFVSSAFNAKESKKLVETTIITPDYAKYNTPGGNDTKDKVFLLSIEEAEKYFVSDESRRAQSSESAKTGGLKWNDSILYRGNGVWFLRTPGLKGDNVCYVNYDGKIYNTCFVDNEGFGIRPAIWVKR